MNFRSLAFASAVLATATLASAQERIPIPVTPLPPDVGAVRVYDPRVFSPGLYDSLNLLTIGQFECALGIVQNSGSSLVGVVEVFNAETGQEVTLQTTGRLSVRGDSPARLTLSGSTGSGINRTSFRMWGVTQGDVLALTIQVQMGWDIETVDGIGFFPDHELIAEDLNESSIYRGVVKGTGVLWVPYSLVPFATNFTSSLNRYSGNWQFSCSSAVGSISFVAGLASSGLDSQDAVNYVPDYEIIRCTANAGYGTMNVDPFNVDYKLDY